MRSHVLHAQSGHRSLETVVSEEKQVNEDAPRKTPGTEARPQSGLDRQMSRGHMLKRFENRFVDLDGTEHEVSDDRTKMSEKMFRAQPRRDVDVDAVIESVVDGFERTFKGLKD